LAEISAECSHLSQRRRADGGARFSECGVSRTYERVVRQVVDSGAGAEAQPIRRSAKTHDVAKPRHVTQVHERGRSRETFVDEDEQIGSATERKRARVTESRSGLLLRGGTVIGERVLHDS